MIPYVSRFTEPLAKLGQRIVERGLELVMVLAGLVLLQQILFFFIRRVARLVKRTAGSDAPEVQRRADTVASLLKSVANVLVIGLGVVFTLEVLGVDVAPFLAGAGILGVALGFGSQSLVKDLITGVFILAEHQFAVGDTIEVAGVTGTVERVTVRSVTLRDFEGRMHYVPNGEIRLVTNLSQGAARFVVDVPIATDADPEKALAAVRDAAQAFGANPVWRGALLEPPEVLGYERIAAGQASIRVVARGLRQDAQMARDLRLSILETLAVRGIELAPGSSNPQGEAT